MKVWSTSHCRFAAIHLVEKLRLLGYQAELITTVNTDDPDLHILYNAVNLPAFPKNYIVYQTEISGSHFFNDRYLAIIKNALAVWEYSESNTLSYKHINTSIVTPGINLQPIQQKDISLLFYGWIEGSLRRLSIINKIKKYHDIMVVTNTTGVSMWNILNRTKIVINIHYYDNSPLELFRINEAISHNCMVISEGNSKRYSDIVFFENDINTMTQYLIPAMKSIPYNQPDLSVIDNTKEIRDALLKIPAVKLEACRV